MEQTQLITARQVAAILAVTPWAVYDLARRGDLPCIRIGNRCIRFLPDDVTEFIQSRRYPALSE